MRNVYLVFAFSIFLITPVQGYAKCGVDATCSHAISIYGEPKYNKHFKHFDYTNPDASKGGDVKFAAIGTFDSFNSHILKGVGAAGLQYLYDKLMVDGGDEPFAKYGLLAETIELAHDRSWIIFHLRNEARFHDNTAITAEDVAFSFNSLKEKGHPRWRSYYREISQVEVLNAHSVKFTLDNPKNRELALILGDFPVFSKAYYQSHDFTKASLDIPLGSGPYELKHFQAGKSLRYQRVENYWAKDLPVNKGRYNFSTINYDYYRDATVAVEAFKAHEYDIRQENISKVWESAYDFPAIHSGKVIKETIEHERPTGMQAFVFNSRKSKLSDPRLREALAYAFDFEWTNKNLFHNAYTRTKSFYANSEFVSSGLPKGRELELLQGFAGQLPKRVFDTEFTVPTTDGSGRNRKNLLQAKKILEQTDWQIKDGILQQNNKPLTLEFLLVSPSFERIIGPMIKNLKKLGITATMRTVDPTQYIKRLEEFDFDIVVSVMAQSLNPGNEQQDYWHSSRADVAGSRNLAGINSPVVDALVDNIISAESKVELVANVKALDRVLLNGFYVIPQWYFQKHRVIYWNRFSRPNVQERYLLGLDNWWVTE